MIDDDEETWMIVIDDDAMLPAIPALRSLAESRGVTLEAVLTAAERGQLAEIVAMGVRPIEERSRCTTAVYSITEHRADALG